jgi:hypothetical protein
LATSSSSAADTAPLSFRQHVQLIDPAFAESDDPDHRGAIGHPTFYRF